MASSMKKSKKKVSHPALNPNAVIATVGDPPTAVAPAPPVGFDPTTMTVSRGHGRVLAAVIAAAQGVGAEILAAPTFTQDFGTKIPATEISGLLTKADGWRQKKKAAEMWADYVKYGDAQAWTVVQWELERFRKLYEGAVSVDASVEQRFPKLAALFAAMSAPGVKAGATRKKKAAATAQAVSAPAAPAAATHPAPAVPPPAPSA